MELTWDAVPAEQQSTETEQEQNSQQNQSSPSFGYGYSNPYDIFNYFFN